MLKKSPIAFAIVSLLALLSGCIAPAPPKPGKKLVTICVQPIYSLHVMTQKYSPLFRYLADETGYDIRVVSAMSYDNYLPTLESNQVHLGIQNPLAYITLVKTRGAHALAKMVESNGNTLYRGTIIARKDSGIQKIEDLRGQTAAASSRRAIGGFFAQAYHCRQYGLDVNKDLRLVFVDTQDAVVNAVYQGKVKAGFVREDALPPEKDRIDLNAITAIAYTDYYPTWCVAAFDETPPDVAREITKALLNLDPENPGHRGVVESIGIAGFQEASDLDYDILRKLMDGLSLPY